VRKYEAVVKSNFKRVVQSKVGAAEAKSTVRPSASGPQSAKRKRRRFALRQLIDGITDANLHGEYHWGLPVAGEVW
jgi:antitoxin component of MazEF toxin-antitoxin module